jgi:LysM repeat protein
MILRKLSQSSFLILTVGLCVFMLSQPPPDASASASGVDIVGQDVYDPYVLIAEVNALRAANGLPALNPDPILMSVSQAHADYMASIGTVTHYGADGSRPFQRSLAAGYPVAGDLSLGGFHSENIVAGMNMTPAQAVSSWTGDAPHLNTMLSPNFTDIGAGVSVAGEKVYYVIDASRKSGSAIPAYTPQTSNGTPVYNLNPIVSTIFPNTPEADGSIIHKVKSGETLWLIAITYGIKVDEILKLNNLPKDSPIFPGQQLVIRKPSQTATPPTSTSIVTRLPLISSPSQTQAVITLIVPSTTLTPAQLAGGPLIRKKGSNYYVPVVIAIGALLIAAFISIKSGRRKRE